MIGLRVGQWDFQKLSRPGARGNFVTAGPAPAGAETAAVATAALYQAPGVSRAEQAQRLGEK